MRRITKNILVNNVPFWTLFDTGAKNTYIVPSVANLLPKQKLSTPEGVALGGSIHHFDEVCILTGVIDGKRIWASACIIDNIGKDDNGKPIEILFGALAMQRWCIIPVPEKEDLDLTHYPNEFVEF